MVIPSASTRGRAGRLSIISLIVLLVSSAPLSAQTARPSGRAAGAQLQAIRKYIKQSWHTLQRSNAKLAVAAVDPKFKSSGITRWPVYVSRKENFDQVRGRLQSEMSAGDFATIEIRRLPEEQGDIREHGLLYLPYPYVVPGGRFNEMYGWDSYFIQVGLLRDGEVELAKNMADNFLYQIDHYGKILNANRSYYLTRSQPPFLTQMILGVYRKTRDRRWLRNTVPAIEKYYRFWTEEPHLTRQTGLSRYYDFGNGPAPEAIADERDAQGKTHYDRVKEYYRTHEVKDYDVSKFYDRERDVLTDRFYKGDRSMRESGFDPSNRFGPFSADIVDYDPVCLNSLLYIMETEAAEIMNILGRPREASRWLGLASQRRDRINRLMWHAEDGLYYDYNYVDKRLRRYPFGTAFYPLWAGIAGREQAARVAANLGLLERAGGLLTSTNESGSQWDSPFGWAPLQLIAVDGLRRYGYNEQADRLAANFLSMVLKEFIDHNTIVEKYDVAARRSQISAGLKFGYTSNEIGFGWTNAAFVELYAGLPESKKRDVLRLDGLPVPQRKSK
ncbi:MAG TPA: trehalase family glycosidase [Blastocatellia bacterium]|nr:trehalase family glycosidase [Blastocatellia bacterium]